MTFSLLMIKRLKSEFSLFKIAFFVFIIFKWKNSSFENVEKFKNKIFFATNLIFISKTKFRSRFFVKKISFSRFDISSWFENKLYFKSKKEFFFYILCVLWKSLNWKDFLSMSISLLIREYSVICAKHFQFVTLRKLNLKINTRVESVILLILSRNLA